MKQLLVLALAILLGSAPMTQAAQAGNPLQQVFVKMDQASKTFRSIEASVERTTVTVLVNDRDVKTGKFYYMRKGKEPRVKIELTKPVPEYFLVDNGKFQHYMPNVKQVQEASIGEHKDSVEMYMALGFGQSSDDLKKNFDVSLVGEEAVNGQKTTVLDLKPKTSGGFKSVRMWLDPEKWIAVQLKITQNSGDYLNMMFTSPKLNKGLSDSKFKLDLPKDVKVVKL